MDTLPSPIKPIVDAIVAHDPELATEAYHEFKANTDAAAFQARSERAAEVLRLAVSGAQERPTTQAEMTAYVEG